MANRVAIGKNLTTGQVSPLSATDLLTDVDGNQVKGASFSGLLAKVTGISLASTGTTTLFTVPANREYIVTEVLLLVTAAVGVSGTPAASIEINGSTDVFGDRPLSGIADDKAYSFGSVGTRTVADAAEVIEMSVNTAVTGTLTVTAYLFGLESSQIVGGTDSLVTARVSKSATQTIPNNTCTTVTWDVEFFDPLNMHDNSVNNSRITVPTSGVYAVYGTLKYLTSSVGVRSLSFRVNGATPLRTTNTYPATSSFGLWFQVSDVIELAAGDYVEVDAFHTAGGNLDIDGTSQEAVAAFSVTKVGESLSNNTSLDWDPLQLTQYVQPPTTGWSWQNQGTSTIEINDAGQFMECPAGSTTYFTQRSRTAPTTPYTITAAFRPFINGVGNQYIGIGWRDSATSEHTICGLLQSSGFWRVADSRYTGTGAGTLDGTYATSGEDFLPSPGSSAPLWGHPIIWVQIEDDGTTNRIVRYSFTGQAFRTLHTVSRTDFLNPDEVVFTVGHNSEGAAFHLLSWKVE